MMIVVVLPCTLASSDDSVCPKICVHFNNNYLFTYNLKTVNSDYAVKEATDGKSVSIMFDVYLWILIVLTNLEDTYIG